MDVYGKFVRGSIILVLTAGCTLGAFLIATIGFSQYWKAVEHSLIQAHGHVQIFGWVGLMIMGVAYHIIPRFKATRLYSDSLAKASFVLMFTGIVLRGLFQPLAQDAVLFVGMTVSGILEVSAVSLFAAVILKTIRSSKQDREVFELFIVGGTVWFLVQTIVTMVLSSYMASQGLAEIPAAIDGAYLHMQIYGFIFMFIFGITVRTLPMFIGLKETNMTLIKLSFVALNAGIILRILGDWSEIIYASPLWNPIVTLSAMLEFFSIIAFILGLNVFKKPAVDMSNLEVDRSYEKFIKIAYVWLPISVSMLLGFLLFELASGNAVEHAFIGAYRHAVVIGFISMMIFGYASRIIPVFRGVKLYSIALSTATFWIINIGNVLRVGSELLVGFSGENFFMLMGVSGFIEVVAIAFFGYNILKTLASPVEVS